MPNLEIQVDTYVDSDIDLDELVNCCTKAELEELFCLVAARLNKSDPVPATSISIDGSLADQIKFENCVKLIEMDDQVVELLID